MNTGGFAVVDVETSGFSPQKNRIVEIGIVLLDPRGQPVHSWSSRFNPQGPVGPTHIHGIRPEDVADAQLFSDAIGEIVALLRGNVFVAHNARFDVSFLRAEFERAGWVLPEAPILCTQEASWHYLDGLDKHRLIDCCGAAGIDITRAHSAIHDAEATAQLLRHYLNPTVPPAPRLDHLELPNAAAVVEWPTVATRTPVPWTPPQATEPSWTWKKRAPSEPLMQAIDRYALSEAIEAGAPEHSTEYLELLLIVLEDGILTTDEGFSLAELAGIYELSRDEIKAAHSGFLIALAHKALADETVTREEREEMKRIAHLLDLSESVVTDAISNARSSRHARHVTTIEVAELPADWSLGEPLRVSDRVAFTGCDPSQRAQLESRAKDLGVRLTGSVSRKTAMLVTDGGFTGTKARAAQAAGTRLVHPADFVVYLEHIQPELMAEGAPTAPPKQGPDEATNTDRPDGGGAVDAAAVREWARANGVSVGDRGRLHRDVINAYAAANSL